MLRNTFADLLKVCGCLCLCLVAGCSGKGAGGSFASFVGDLPEGGAVASIASDASAQVAELYPPGHTSIFLLTAEEDAESGFSSAFENALRQSGFTVLQGPEENAVAVAFLLDGFVEEKKDGVKVWYLRFLVSDNDEKGMAFARTYTASGRAEAGWTRTEVDFSRSVAARLADKAAAKAGKAYDRTADYLTE